MKDLKKRLAVAIFMVVVLAIIVTTVPLVGGMLFALACVVGVVLTIFGFIYGVYYVVTGNLD